MFEFIGDMFENVGEKLKKFAKILFVLAVIGDIICAFIFGIETDYYRDGVLNDMFWIFLLIGPIVSYLQSMILYGFGELVEKTTKTKQLMEKVVNNDVVTPEEKEQKEIDDALKF